MLISRFHQVPATPEGLRHQYAPLPDELGKPSPFGDMEILKAAKSLGFRAKAVVVKPTQLDNAALPLDNQRR